MTLEQLRIFVTVADRLHVTRAAELLNLTQSAVSAAIAALENRHNVQLFHRVGRRIELTEPGTVFVGEAKAVLARADSAELVLDELAELNRGSLSVHASQTIANYWLPPLLYLYRQRYPNIVIGLVIGNTTQVARAVLDGTANIGFVEGAFNEAGLEELLLEGDALALVVGRSHPWAKRQGVAAHELRDTEWVLREPGSGTRSEFEDAITAQGVSLRDLRVVLELPSNEAVQAAVATGAGATAVSELAIKSSLAAGILHTLEFAFPARPFRAVWHKERYRTKSVLALLELVRSHAGDHA